MTINIIEITLKNVRFIFLSLDCKNLKKMIAGFYNILEADNLSTEYIFFITEVVRYKL